MWGQEQTTFGNMPGNEVTKLKQKREREREREERVREEEERKNLYKFNIGDKIKVKEIAEIYKPQLNINIGKVGEISRIFDYVNNKISYGKGIVHLAESTRKEVYCTDIDLSEEFPDGVGTEPGPEAPDIIYDILFNISDNDNPAKNKWIELYFSEDGIEKMNKGGKRKKRRKSLFKKSLFKKKRTKKERKRKTRRKPRKKTRRKRRI